MRLLAPLTSDIFFIKKKSKNTDAETHKSVKAVRLENAVGIGPSNLLQ